MGARLPRGKEDLARSDANAARPVTVRDSDDHPDSLEPFHEPVSPLGEADFDPICSASRDSEAGGAEPHHAPDCPPPLAVTVPPSLAREPRLTFG